MVCVDVIYIFSIRTMVRCSVSPLPLVWPFGLLIHSCFGLLVGPLVVLLVLLDAFNIITYSPLSLFVLSSCVCPLSLHGA
jgi:hypothetical protein